jgi:hypothetical protein
VTATVAPGLSNLDVAHLLRETADLLEAQRANAFRVLAWRRAAEEVAGLPEPVADLVARRGAAGLDELPGIGPGLAHAIADLVHSGRLVLLDRLRGRAHPETLLATLPGVGPVLADRIHHDLGIGTLEDLEVAAHDGRLEAVPGLGAKRVEGIRQALAGRLRRPRPPAEHTEEQRPPVAELLDVDQEYRRKARVGELRLIAPRRFNPRGEAWLPILHANRGGRDYTALFSNTPLAHRLGRVHDWVVLYYDGPRATGQATAVTEHSGPLRGRRVVRGREGECVQYYGIRPPEDPRADTDGDGVI